MGARRVVFSRYADRDLRRIVRFIARDNPSAAERVGLRLIDRALALSDPAIVMMGAALKKRPEFRKLVEGRYWIFYRVFPDRVRILRFWHSARNPRKLKLDV
jgi:plasmid stabilization system protein ParE